MVDSHQRLSIAYRPQANGVVERRNAEIIRHLRILVTARRLKTAWSTYLPIIQRVINATPHRVTGVAPAVALYGPLLDTNAGLLKHTCTESTGLEQAVASLSDKNAQSWIIGLQQAHKLIHENIRLRQLSVIQKHIANSPTNARDLKQGDIVLVKPIKYNDKLEPRLKGPYFIVSDRGPGDSYICRHLYSQTAEHVHVERMMPLDWATLEEEEKIQIIAALDEDLYEVEEITAVKKGRNKPMNQWLFRVKWAGYPDDENSWLTLRDLRNTTALFRYAQKHPNLKLPTEPEMRPVDRHDLRSLRSSDPGDDQTGSTF